MTSQSHIWFQSVIFFPFQEFKPKVFFDISAMRVTISLNSAFMKRPSQQYLLKINYNAPSLEISCIFRLFLMSRPSLTEYLKYYIPFAPTYFQFLHFGWFRRDINNWRNIGYWKWTIRTVNTTYAAALKTTTHPKTRCRKPYAATQHLMLLMMGVCTRNMSS